MLQNCLKTEGTAPQDAAPRTAASGVSSYLAAAAGLAVALTVGIALTPIVTASIGVSVGASMELGATSMVAGNATQRGIESGSLAITFNPQALAKDAVIGAATGVVAHAAGALVKYVGNKFGNAAVKGMQEAETAGSGATGVAGRLRALDGGAWESAAGLRYGPGSAQGNRVLHVLEHAADIPGRAGPHGVFAGGRSRVIGTIDEAYGAARAGGPGVSVAQHGARTVYTVDMGRTVGFIGGQAGAALGNSAASHVRLVLEGTNVITAFPVIP